MEDIGQRLAGAEGQMIGRRILVFFLLAYVFSWFGLLGNQLYPGSYWPLPMNPFGPLMAAIVVLWASSGRAGLRQWFRRLGNFRAPLWIYAVALLGPVAIIAAALVLARFSGVELLPLPERGPVEFLVLIPIMLLAGPLPEEISFRGYGQHALQSATTPLAAALLIGLGVVVWHMPLFVMGHVPYPFIVTLIAVSIVYAWLYQHGGSVWPLVALHFAVNYFGGEYLGSMIGTSAGQVTYAWYFMGFYVLWAALVVWRHGTGLGRSN